MLYIQFSYFDNKGNQKIKELQTSKKETLLKKIQKHEIYQVLQVNTDFDDLKIIDDLELNYNQFGYSLNLWK